MDMLAYCQAMASFSRQRAVFENEDASFWINEAEGWDEISFEMQTRPIQFRLDECGKPEPEDHCVEAELAISSGNGPASSFDVQQPV